MLLRGRASYTKTVFALLPNLSPSPYRYFASLKFSSCLLPLRLRGTSSSSARAAASDFGKIKFDQSTQPSAFKMYGRRGDPHARLLDTMLIFHTGFRQDFRQIVSVIGEESSPSSLSTKIISDSELEEVLAVAQGLYSHLDAHHRIEETYIFPILAKKMEDFKGDHIKEHALIHDALEALHSYTRQCQQRYAQYLNMKKRGACNERPSNVFDAVKMRQVMEKLRPVLFDHLAHEEKSLEPSNMRKYWTAEEMARIPI